jgi:hypothetical protein
MTPNQIAKAQRKILDKLARKHLAFFTQYGLGHTNAPHHVEWYDILQDKLYTPEENGWDDELVDVPIGHVHYNDRIVVMAPRSHSKSTCFTVNYPLWEIGRDPNIRVLIVSSTATIAQGFLREIKGQMKNNKTYRRIFGDLFPDEEKEAEKWTNSEIIVNRTNYKIKDPTISTVGSGGAILSKRADIIICDDILSPENTRTEEQREKMRTWFKDVLLPVLEPDGKIIVVGTAWNLEDLYHELMKKTKTYKVRRRYKAVIDPEAERVLWPERWTYQKLMALRDDEIGITSFNKSYQNEAISSEDAVFQPAWTEAAKKRGANRTLLPDFDYSWWDLGPVTISMGVDLAISKKSTADKTAFAVIARLADGRKLPLWLESGRYSPAETRSRIIELYENYHPEIIIVETNAYQASLQIDLAEQTDMPIKGYVTGGEKFDEEVGLNSLAVEFENDKWILPYSNKDGYTIRNVDELVQGMLQFPSGHTADILMALWFANTGMRQLISSPKTSGTARIGKQSFFR